MSLLILLFSHIFKIPSSWYDITTTSSIIEILNCQPCPFLNYWYVVRSCAQWISVLLFPFQLLNCIIAFIEKVKSESQIKSNFWGQGTSASKDESKISCNLSKQCSFVKYKTSKLLSNLEWTLKAILNSLFNTLRKKLILAPAGLTVIWNLGIFDFAYFDVSSNTTPHLALKLPA